MKLSYLKAALILPVFISAFTVFSSSRVIVAQQAQFTPPSTQSSAAEEIKLFVTATDQSGYFITGLDRSVFAIEDNKVVREIVSFESKDVPVSLGILFDISASTSPMRSKSYVAAMLEAMTRFIKQSHHGNEYFLIAFNQSAQILQDWTHDGDAILNQFAAVKIKGNTAFFDAFQLGLEKVLHGANPKRVLLLISDGQDNLSRTTFKELIRSIRQSDVLVYSITMAGMDVGSSLSMQGQGVLEEITSVSGGRAYFPESTVGLNKTLEQMASELRHQYSIGFKPLSPANENKWHSIKIKAQPTLINNHKVKLYVRSREGYFPNSIQR